MRLLGPTDSQRNSTLPGRTTGRGWVLFHEVYPLCPPSPSIFMDRSAKLKAQTLIALKMVHMVSFMSSILYQKKKEKTKIAIRSPRDNWGKSDAGGRTLAGSMRPILSGAGLRGTVPHLCKRVQPSQRG